MQGCVDRDSNRFNRIHQLTHPPCLSPSHHHTPNHPITNTHSDVEVAFPSAARASTVMAVLEVDEELQPTRVAKSFATEGPVLRV